jgi:hypothetical protein
LTLNMTCCFPFSLKIWRVLAPKKRHDMYLLHSSLRSTFGNKFIESEKKMTKNEQILLAKIHHLWVENIIPSYYNKHFICFYMVFCLKASIINDLRLSKVTKESKAALSNTSLNRILRTFIGQKQ